MKHETSTYLAIFAATTNVVASGFLVYALDKRHVYETDSAATAAQTLGGWLFMLSVALWLAFILSRLNLKRK